MIHTTYLLPHILVGCRRHHQENTKTVILLSFHELCVSLKEKTTLKRKRSSRDLNHTSFVGVEKQGIATYQRRQCPND